MRVDGVSTVGVELDKDGTGEGTREEEEAFDCVSVEEESVGD